MATQTRTQATSSKIQGSPTREKETEHFLFIHGELKDDIRKIPPDGYIRQAHTDNENGTGWGHITILNQQKALDAYDYLYKNGWRGRSVRLSLVKKDDMDPEKLQRIRGPEDSHSYPPPGPLPTQPFYPYSVPAVFPGLPVPPGYHGAPGPFLPSGMMPMMPGPSPPMVIQPAFVNQTYIPMQTPFSQPTTQPLPNLQQLSHPTFESPHIYAVGSPFPSKTSNKPQASPQGPLYHHKSSTFRSWNKGPKGNSPQDSISGPTRDRAPKSETSQTRSIFLYDLPALITEENLKERFSCAGKIEEVAVKKDRSREWKYKYTAMITFQNHQQALNAIRTFKNTQWENCSIKLKLDSGPSPPVSCPANPPKPARPKRKGPVVVDGSKSTIKQILLRCNSDSEPDSDSD